ncbi:hypothetical protein [Paraclostridium sordellii]|uniref:hypothetical protein n=1 Tax=Paraclostridium sordellii TaxID=1505 RepID=UPI0030D1AD60
MARGKMKIDESEIKEIIDLKVENLNGIVSRLTYNGVCEFNKQIANNPKYKRSNGELFKEYGYTVWAGTYKGEDYIGKKMINDIKEKNKVPIVGADFRPEVQDIIQLVNDLHNKPEKLTLRLCKIFDRERKNTEEMRKELKMLKKKKSILEEKIELMETSMTNLIFQSQSIDNSLNNMFDLKKSKDSVCYNELLNMFNNNDSRIKSLFYNNNIEDMKKDNVISISEKTKGYIDRGL